MLIFSKAKEPGPIFNVVSFFKIIGTKNVLAVASEAE